MDVNSFERSVFLALPGFDKGKLVVFSDMGFVQKGKSIHSKQTDLGLARATIRIWLCDLGHIDW